MQIIVPYVQLYAETVEAVPDARFVEITHDDDYRLLLHKFWDEGEATPGATR